jgi:nucleoside 2-deoxyribosyltransferase
MPVIYVAGPLGFSEAGRDFYYRTFLLALKSAGLEVIDPWQPTDRAKVERVSKMRSGDRKRQAWASLNMVIGKNNQSAIDRCDGVLAILDGADVDSGTAAEIGYAFGIGKKIIGYRGDFRLSADNEGCTVNLQVEYFIRRSGGTIVPSLAELTGLIENVFNHVPS